MFGCAADRRREARRCDGANPSGATIERPFAPRAKSMNQHARMLKTLGCLAAAMTSTAVFLHWLDPSSSSNRESSFVGNAELLTQSLSAGEVAALARSLVTDAVDIKPEQWREVEVVPGPTTTGAGTLLTASRDPVACHFYVDQAGRPSRARGWSRQTPPYDAPHTVRIQVARAAGIEAFPTPLQWFTIRSLVDALDAALLQNGTMPVHVQGGSADAASLLGGEASARG